jgi:hypothetical protein
MSELERINLHIADWEQRRDEDAVGRLRDVLPPPQQIARARRVKTRVAPSAS